jgi:hypothetical protein
MRTQNISTVRMPDAAGFERRPALSHAERSAPPMTFEQRKLAATLLGATPANTRRRSARPSLRLALDLAAHYRGRSAGSIDLATAKARARALRAEGRR